MSLSRTPGIHPIQNTSSVLIADNSVFDKGRVVLETDTNRVKTGDGVSTYTQLTYVEWNYEIVEAAGTDTYTGNFSKPFFLAYFQMMRIRVRFTNANTGAATINLNGLGAIAIKKSVSTALSAGDIMAGGIYELCYDGTNFQIPAAVGGTASTPSLTATYVGFGSGANVLTGSADLVWTGSQLTVNGTISSTGYKISGAAATGTILRGNGTSYVASTNTYPNITGAGQILYATAANTIGGATDFLRLSTGELIIGHTASLNSLYAIQAFKSASSVAMILASYSTTDSHNGFINFFKSNSNTIGTGASTANGEALGSINAIGYNTSNTVSQGASIRFFQDGAGGAALIPGRIDFRTGTAAAAETTSLLITSVKNIKIAGAATRATTEGTNHLDIFDGTAPVGTLTNGVSLYSVAGKLWAMDAGGAATQLTP